MHIKMFFFTICSFLLKKQTKKVEFVRHSKQANANLTEAFFNGHILF